MLSASEASAFQFRNKADSSEEFILSMTKGLRMTFKDRLVGRPHFFKREHEGHEGRISILLNFVFFATFVVKFLLCLVVAISL
jgi:hypothetical protein